MRRSKNTYTLMPRALYVHGWLACNGTVKMVCSGWVDACGGGAAPPPARRIRPADVFSEGGTCEVNDALEASSGSSSGSGCCGLGRFQCMLIGASVLLNISVMSLVLIFSLVLGDVAFAFSLDVHEDSVVLSFLGASMYLGWLVGAFFWGSIADSHGRRLTYIWTTVLLVGSGMSAAFCHSLSQLAVLRFASGFACGGAESVAFILLCEFCPPDSRSYANLIFQCGGSVGVAYLGWAGSLMLEDVVAGATAESQEQHHATLHAGWRRLDMLAAAPATALLLLSYFLPESPQYLLSQGKPREAWLALKASALVNGVAAAELPSELTLTMVKGSAAGHGHGGGGGGREDEAEGGAEQQQQSLLGPGLRMTTLICWLMWCSCGLVYYGLTEQAGHEDTTEEVAAVAVAVGYDKAGTPRRWLSEAATSATTAAYSAVLGGSDGQGGSDIVDQGSAAATAAAAAAVSTGGGHGGQHGSSSSSSSSSRYWSLAVSGLLEVPAYTAIYYGMDYFGRRATMVCSLSGIGVCSAFLLLAPMTLRAGREIAPHVSKGLISGAFSCAYCWTAELFPAAVRGRAMGTCSAAARLGSMGAPFVVVALAQIHDAIPSIVFGEWPANHIKQLSLA